MRSEYYERTLKTLKLPNMKTTIENTASSDCPAETCSVFYEEITERIGEHVVISTVRPATAEEIVVAQRLNEKGECPHNIIQDEQGWMYDFRSCFTCGKGLGTV